MTALLALTLLAAPFDWDVPKPVAHARIGDRPQAMGLELDLHLVRSQWKLNDLAVHYARRFLEAGFYVAPGQRPFPGSNLPRLTALDPVSLVSYTVVFYPEADGTTTLLLGAADLGHRRPASPDAFPAPAFPAAKKPSTFELEGARALTYLTAATEAELMGFYRDVLPRAGWRELGDQPGTFVRSGRSLRVLARGEGPHLAVVVLEQPQSSAHRSP